MALPYSTQFFLGAVSTAGTLLYTVPAGNVAVLRDIEILNTSSTAIGPSFFIQSTRGAATIWHPPDIPPSNWVQWLGRTVMNAGDELLANVGFDQSMQAIVSGYLLET